LVSDSPGWADAGRQFSDAGVDVVSAMVGCVGEDYSSIARIRQTGGVIPDATWPMTLANMQASAPVAERIGAKLVTLHAGFIPDDPADPASMKGIERISQIADVFANHGAAIALETGQESANALLQFLTALGRRDVGVNFDPANMILYGSGDPIAALKLLTPHLKQVHAKDATRSARPGVDWGKEVPVGAGQVDWDSFLATLASAGYAGDLVIEREAGAQRVPDIRAGVAFLREKIGPR